MYEASTNDVETNTCHKIFSFYRSGLMTDGQQGTLSTILASFIWGSTPAEGPAFRSPFAQIVGGSQDMNGLVNLKILGPRFNLMELLLKGCPALGLHERWPELLKLARKLNRCIPKRSSKRLSAGPQRYTSMERKRNWIDPQ